MEISRVRYLCGSVYCCAIHSNLSFITWKSAPTGGVGHLNKHFEYHADRWSDPPTRFLEEMVCRGNIPWGERTTNSMSVYIKEWENNKENPRSEKSTTTFKNKEREKRIIGGIKKTTIEGRKERLKRKGMMGGHQSTKYCQTLNVPHTNKQTNKTQTQFCTFII